MVGGKFSSFLPCDKEGNTSRPAGSHLVTLRIEAPKNEFNSEEAKLTRTEKETVT